MQFRLKQGLALGLQGAPIQSIAQTRLPARSALMLEDYKDLHPELLVDVGDQVAKGQALIRDRRSPSVVYPAFASGTVRHIEKGVGPRIDSVVLEHEGERSLAFEKHEAGAIAALPQTYVRDHFLRSGFWPAFRARPYGRVAQPSIDPRAIFVTAIDTNPLAPEPSIVINERSVEFWSGLRAIAKLTQGSLYLCTAPRARFGSGDANIKNLRRLEFHGKHPAGLPGTHIHAVGLAPGSTPDLWHIGYQDVLAAGHLLLHGETDSSRVISLCGPAAREPRLLRTCLGAEVSHFADEASMPGVLALSGSLFHASVQPKFLGRYDNQLTLMSTELPRKHWLQRLVSRMKATVFATNNTSIALQDRRRMPGGMLPTERFDDVWPFRSPPLALLRALLAQDHETAQALGCLGLVEEDLALCQFICPSKRNYASALRNTLKTIETWQ